MGTPAVEMLWFIITEAEEVMFICCFSYWPRLVADVAGGRAMAELVTRALESYSGVLSCRTPSAWYKDS